MPSRGQLTMVARTGLLWFFFPTALCLFFTVTLIFFSKNALISSLHKKITDKKKQKKILFFTFSYVMLFFAHLEKVLQIFISSFQNLSAVQSYIYILLSYFISSHPEGL